jgi:hypothetical protein
MKDVIKEGMQAELNNVQLNQTLSEAPADHNLPTLIELPKTQNVVSIKVPGAEDEIIYEESSQRYADRKITQ